MRVGGRGNYSKLSYAVCHPVILSRKHEVSKLLIRSEHVRLFNGGPILLAASLSHLFHVHVLGARKAIRSITCACTVCHCATPKPRPRCLDNCHLIGCLLDQYFSVLDLIMIDHFLTKETLFNDPP